MRHGRKSKNCEQKVNEVKKKKLPRQSSAKSALLVDRKHHKPKEKTENPATQKAETQLN